VAVFDFHYDHIFKRITDDDAFERWLDWQISRFEDALRDAYAAHQKYRSGGEHVQPLTARELRQNEQNEIEHGVLGNFDIGSNYVSADSELRPFPNPDWEGANNWTERISGLFRHLNAVETFLNRKMREGQIDLVFYDKLASRILELDGIKTIAKSEALDEHDAFDLREVIREIVRAITNRYPQWRNEIDQLATEELWLSMDRKPSARNLDEHTLKSNEEVKPPGTISFLIGRGREDIWSRMTHELSEEESAIRQFLVLKRATMQEQDAVWDGPNKILSEIGEHVGGQHQWRMGHYHVLKHALSVARDNIAAIDPIWADELRQYLLERRNGKSPMRSNRTRQPLKLGG